MAKPKELLDIAKSDLDASERLYEDGSYNQAVFYLEQSIEKTAKAFGLEVGIIEEEELQSLGHHHEKIFIQIQDKMFEFLSDVLPSTLLNIVDEHTEKGWGQLDLSNPDVFQKYQVEERIEWMENLSEDEELYSVFAIRILHLLVPWPYAIIPRYPTEWGSPLELTKRKPIPLYFFKPISTHTDKTISGMHSTINNHTFRNLFEHDFK